MIGQLNTSPRVDFGIRLEAVHAGQVLGGTRRATAVYVALLHINVAPAGLYDFDMFDRPDVPGELDVITGPELLNGPLHGLLLCPPIPFHRFKNPTRPLQHGWGV